MTRGHRVAGTALRLVVAAVLSLVLAGCGGGGSTTPPTELPPSLALIVPTSQQATGAAIAFASNAVDPAKALTYRWEFGDGATSSVASPDHAYSKPGIYTVRLTLTNEAGATVSTASTVAVADLAIVKGKACSGADNSGWCWQRPLPQGNIILDYAFIDDTHGWAVGEAGTVLATTDAGATWKPQVSGTELNLTKLAIANAQFGWVAGTNGELLKTNSGGAIWQRVSFGQNEPVQALGALDANTAWVTASCCSTYTTTDGGSTWKRIVGPPGGFQKLVLVNSSNIWALPFSSGTAPTLAHSLDGGVTWSDVSLPPVEPGFSRFNSDLQFSGATNGLLAATEQGFIVATQTFISRQVAWRTADGGASWQPFNPPASSAFSSNPYQFVDANTVFTLAFPGSALERTTDGGATWQSVPLPTFINSFLVSYQAYSARRLIVRDASGRAYLTTDGGVHWSVLSAGGTFSPSLNGVWFFDSREGLAIGSDGSSVRTADGGQTWITTTPNGFFGWRRAQFLADGSKGWVISDTGAIYLSTDKGKTWLSPVPQTSTPLGGVTDFHFIDERQGWAVSPFAFTGQDTLYRTSDGGLSWQSVAGTSGIGGLTSLRFADATHGAAVGPAGVATVTVDGGTTWSPRPTGIDRNLRRVTFADAKTAVAVGDNGFIVRSSDQGQTWTRVASPTTNTLNDVRFLSATTGYAVGDFGTLILTRDGGATWALQSTGAHANLQAAFFVDEQTGWVVGDNGNILATVSGGR
jgi:photosystem II stability/assembly factor-like uncharacterized protein